MPIAAPTTHQQAAHKPTRARAWQRFGLVIGSPEVKAIEAFIRVGGGLVLREESDGCRVVELAYRGKEIFLVWNPDADCVVTVLPKGWAKRERKRR